MEDIDVILDANSDCESNVPADVGQDVADDLVAAPKRRKEKEKWCGRCGYLVKRDWKRHWRISHKGWPVQELLVDDFSYLRAPFYGEKRTKISIFENMYETVGNFEVDSHTKNFNKRLWNLMKNGYRIPYALWTLA